MSSVNAITGSIVGAAIKVHQELGPGLLESAYEACLMYELRELGLAAKNQLTLPIRYKDVEIMLDTASICWWRTR